MTSLFHPLYFSFFPQGATVTPRAHGLDFSKYDLFFEPITATGQLDFGIQRVSYSTAKDEAFDKLLPGLLQLPIRGAYHYLSSGITWQTQANKFISIVNGIDYHFFACDFEGAFNVLGTDFAYKAWQWIHYVKEQTGKPVVLYTSLSLYNAYILPSQRIYNIDWSTIPQWSAQWFFTPNPNGTPGLKNWKLWQYTNKGDGTKYGVARTGECDLDVFNGTPDDMRAWLNIAAPDPSNTDVTTMPRDGMVRVSGKRNGWTFELFKLDPSKFDFEVVVCNPPETPSSVAKRKNALLAVPAGDYDRFSYIVQDYLVSNGHEYVKRFAGGGRPSLMLLKLPHAWHIDTVDVPDVEQAITGVHSLVHLGQVNIYLFDTSQAQNVEGHARFVFALDAQGNLILIASEGVYPNQGLTLLDITRLAMDYGAIEAGDGGGGGDVACVLDGQSLIVTENIDPASGNHFERTLPVVLCVYAKELNMNGTAKENQGNGSTKRKQASRYGEDTGLRVMAYSKIDFTAIADVTIMGNADAPSDKWLKLPDGNYVNYILAGKKYYDILTQPTSDPNPPPATDEIITQEINVTAKTVTTTLPSGWTGTTK